MRVASARARFELSKPFGLEVETLPMDGGPAVDALVGKSFKLTLRDALEARSFVHGYVYGVRRRMSSLGAVSHVLTLGPAVSQLTYGTDSRIFQEMDAVAAIKAILDTASIDASVEWRVHGSFPVRPYIVQYRESDWDVIARLAGEEGITYFFEHTADDTTLVFADDTTHASSVPGDAAFTFRDPAGLMMATQAVHSLGRRHEMVPTGVRYRDYNFEQPSLSLDVSAGDDTLERYDCPGRFADPSEGQRLADVELEALTAEAEVTYGEAVGGHLQPGMTFEIEGHPLESMNGTYLLLEVNYTPGKETSSGGAELPVEQELTVAWRAIAVDTRYRAARTSPTRSTGGPQTGIVVGPPGEEILSDDTGRVRVQLYWDREGGKDDKASTWMRVGQFALGGSMIMPRIGWDVLVGFNEDDVDVPFVAGHVYDGTHPVPYTLPENKTRTAWQTATTPGDGTSNEIRFEDKKGSEEIFMNATKDMNVTIGDNKTDKVGVDYTHTIGSNLDVTVGTQLVCGITDDQSCTVGGSETVTVGGDRGTQIKGSETVTVGGSRTVTVTMGSKVEAKSGRTLTVGGSMMDVAALGVNRLVLGSLSITVGGAWVSAAATGVDNITGGAVAETVGGAKVCAGASGVETSVKGALAETVGGAYAIAAGGNVGEQATGPLVFNVGGALLANAPTIEIEAESEISIRCGGSSVKVKSGSVEVKAPTILAPGAVVNKKGSVVKHN